VVLSLSDFTHIMSHFNLSHLLAKLVNHGFLL